LGPESTLVGFGDLLPNAVALELILNPAVRLYTMLVLVSGKIF